MAREIVKTFGTVKLTFTPPFPRWLTIERTDVSGVKLYGIDLEQARDLHYALGRMIKLADEQDQK